MIAQYCDQLTKYSSVLVTRPASQQAEEGGGRCVEAAGDGGVSGGAQCGSSGGHSVDCVDNVECRQCSYDQLPTATARPCTQDSLIIVMVIILVNSDFFLQSSIVSSRVSTRLHSTDLALCWVAPLCRMATRHRTRHTGKLSTLTNIFIVKTNIFSVDTNIFSVDTNTF